MGEVWVAADAQLASQVAIKFYRAHGVDVLDWEWTILGKFHNDPNVIGVRGRGAYKGIPFLVMEYAPIGTVTKWIEDPSNRTLSKVWPLFREICAAMAEVHRRKVTHRDLKGQNVLLAEVRGAVVPKLADFGVALAEEHASMTTGSFVGTRWYAAPEQLNCERRIVAAADVFALVVLFIEMLTGTNRPFPGRKALAWGQVAGWEDAEPEIRDALRRLRIGLPPATLDVLVHGLHRNPNKRYPSAAELLAALERTLEVPRNEPDPPVQPVPVPIPVSAPGEEHEPSTSAPPPDCPAPDPLPDPPALAALPDPPAPPPVPPSAMNPSPPVPGADPSRSVVPPPPLRPSNARRRTLVRSVAGAVLGITSLSVAAIGVWTTLREDKVDEPPVPIPTPTVTSHPGPPPDPTQVPVPPPTLTPAPTSKKPPLVGSSRKPESVEPKVERNDKHLRADQQATLTAQNAGKRCLKQLGANRPDLHLLRLHVSAIVNPSGQLFTTSVDVAEPEEARSCADQVRLALGSTRFEARQNKTTIPIPIVVDNTNK